MAPTLTHIWLLVGEMPRALTFYQATLGLELANDLGEYAEFKVSEDVYLALFTRSAMLAGEPNIALSPASGQRAVLAFEVASVDAEADRLRARGVRLISEPANHAEWGLRTLFLHDPDDNLVCLYAGIPEGS
ncbi:MAG TPA: VOC family protein [Ktedonobacterales bacterium]